MQWYVTLEDCRAGHGKMVILDMDGEYQYENDFAADGGTVSTDIAEVRCVIHPLVKKSAEH